MKQEILQRLKTQPWEQVRPAISTTVRCDPCELHGVTSGLITHTVVQDMGLPRVLPVENSGAL